MGSFETAGEEGRLLFGVVGDFPNWGLTTHAPKIHREIGKILPTPKKAGFGTFFHQSSKKES